MKNHKRPMFFQRGLYVSLPKMHSTQMTFIVVYLLLPKCTRFSNWMLSKSIYDVASIRYFDCKQKCTVSAEWWTLRKSMKMLSLCIHRAAVEIESCNYDIQRWDLITIDIWLCSGSEGDIISYLSFKPSPTWLHKFILHNLKLLGHCNNITTLHTKFKQMYGAKIRCFNKSIKNKRTLFTLLSIKTLILKIYTVPNFIKTIHKPGC